MNQLKSRRKTARRGGPDLRLVPAPAPRRQSRRWKLPRSLRSMRKPKYGSNPHLLRYEEELVLAAIKARKNGATLDELMKAEPDRWRPRFLWRTIQRLRAQDKLTGWKSYAPMWGKVRRHERYDYRPTRPDGRPQ